RAGLLAADGADGVALEDGRPGLIAPPRGVVVLGLWLGSFACGSSARFSASVAGAPALADWDVFGAAFGLGADALVDEGAHRFLRRGFRFALMAGGCFARF